MPAEERRRAIVDATLPLLLEKGPELSTRQIARAAGVAEGTIFRAFDTKADLIHATIHAALRPDAALAALAALPAGQTLAERTACVFDILRADITRTRSLFATIFAGRQHPHVAPPGHKGALGSPHDLRALLLAGTTDAFVPYSNELRISPATAASILSAVAFATTITSNPDLDDSDLLADLVLHGLAHRPQGDQ